MAGRFPEFPIVAPQLPERDLETQGLCRQTAVYLLVNFSAFGERDDPRMARVRCTELEVE